MATREELLREAYERGLLQGPQKDAYEEAVRRGVIRPAMSWGDAAVSAIKNIPRSAANTLGDMANVVLHPIDTATALGGLAAGAAEKLIPGEQGQERYVDGLLNYVKSRYGSSEGFKNALAQDPVGILADMSTPFTGGSGVLRGVGALTKGAGRAARGLGAARAGNALGTLGSAASSAGDALGRASAAVDPMNAVIPRASEYFARRLYQGALKPSTTLKPAERDALIQTGLDERIPVTRGGYSKASGIVRDLDDQVTDVLEKAKGEGKTIDPGFVMDYALDTINNKLRSQVSPTKDLDTGMKQILDFEDNWGKHPLTPLQAQEIKQGTYRSLGNKAYKHMPGSELKSAEVEAQKALASGLREGIEEAAPQVKPLNQRSGRIQSLMTELERGVGRTNNWNILSMPGLIAGGAVGSVGGLGPSMVTTALTSAMRDPWLKSQAAFWLHNPQNLLNARRRASTAYLGGRVADMPGMDQTSREFRQQVLDGLLGAMARGN